MKTFSIELPDGWELRREWNHAILERTEHPAAKLTFHYRKEYQWRMHKLDGDIAAFQLSELCTLMRYIEWDNIEMEVSLSPRTSQGVTEKQ